VVRKNGDWRLLVEKDSVHFTRQCRDTFNVCDVILSDSFSYKITAKSHSHRIFIQICRSCGRVYGDTFYRLSVVKGLIVFEPPCSLCADCLKTEVYSGSNMFCCKLLYTVKVTYSGIQTMLLDRDLVN